MPLYRTHEDDPIAELGELHAERESRRLPATTRPLRARLPLRRPPRTRPRRRLTFHAA